jgi:hypothetical protein
MKKIIITETQLKKVVDRVLNEADLTNYNFNKAVQLFLITKKITDSNNQPIKKDGSIGRLPNSKSAQAIAKYQTSIGVAPDGVWGSETTDKMKTKFPNDYKLWLQCKSDEGDLFDKGAHLLGLDEQLTNVARPTNVTRPTPQTTAPNLVGKTVNLYSDIENKKFYIQARIGNIQKTNDGRIVLRLTNKIDLIFTCANQKKNEFTYNDRMNGESVLVYNTPLATQLRKLMCTVSTGGTTVPKADFASNTQIPTSDFA